MSFIKALFRLYSADENTYGHDEGVTINFKYGKANTFPIYRLERVLAIKTWLTNAGEVDGHEVSIDLTEGSIYLYGTDANFLFKVVKGTLMRTSFLKGATVTLSYDPIGKGQTKDIQI